MLHPTSVLVISKNLKKDKCIKYNRFKTQIGMRYKTGFFPPKIF